MNRSRDNATPPTTAASSNPPKSTIHGTADDEGVAHACTFHVTPLAVTATLTASLGGFSVAPFPSAPNTVAPSTTRTATSAPGAGGSPTSTDVALELTR